MVAPISSINPGFNFTLLQRLNDIRLNNLNSSNRIFGSSNTAFTRSFRSNFPSFGFVRIDAPQLPGRVVVTGRENDVRVQDGLFALDFEGSERFATSVTLEIGNDGRVFDRNTGARLQRFDEKALDNRSSFEISKDDRNLSAEPSSGFSFSGNISNTFEMGESTTQDLNLLGPDGETLQFDSEFTVSAENELTVNLLDPDSGDSLLEGVLTFDDEGNFESITVPEIEDNEPNVLSISLDEDDPDGETLNFTADDLNFSQVTLTDSNTTLEAKQTGGFIDGRLDSLSVNSSGELIGQFSNEETRSFGPVAFAQFSDPSELQASVGRLFETTPQSGGPQIQSQSNNRFNIENGFLDVESPLVGRQFVSQLISQNQFQSPFLDFSRNPFQNFEFTFRRTGQLFDRFA